MAMCTQGRTLAISSGKTTEAGVDFIFVDWSNDINYYPSAPQKKMFLI